MVFKEGSWSKSVAHKPKDNLQSHIYINKKPFRSSIQTDHSEPTMANILSGEYGRIYECERLEYAKKNYNKKTFKGSSLDKIFVARFNNWLEKYNATRLNIIRA